MPRPLGDAGNALVVPVVLGAVYALLRAVEPQLPVWLARLLLGSAKPPLYTLGPRSGVESVPLPRPCFPGSLLWRQLLRAERRVVLVCGVIPQESGGGAQESAADEEIDGRQHEGQSEQNQIARDRQTAVIDLSSMREVA